MTPDLIGDICTRPLAGATQPEAPLAEQSLENVERAHVLRVLEATHWHRGKACEILGVSRPRLRRMIQHFGIVPPPHAPDDEAADETASGPDSAGTANHRD